MKTRKYRKPNTRKPNSRKRNKMSKHRRKRYSNRKTRRKVLKSGGWLFSKDLSKLTLPELYIEQTKIQTQMYNYKTRQGFQKQVWDKLGRRLNNINEKIKEATTETAIEETAEADEEDALRV